MCWSATADLAAGTVIAAAGLASTACTLLRGRPRELPLAALPLLLGAHQIVEAVIWHRGGGSGPWTTAWAVIALPLLALWIPFGVLLAAQPRERARLAVPAAAGTVTAAVLAHALATGTVTADIREHTVGYGIGVPFPAVLLGGYLLATVGSLLLAGDGRLRLLGLLAGAGALVSALLWRTAFVSTWCAVAAVASLTLLAWSRRPVLPAGRPPAPAGPGANT
ncbi:DUF6629 family protein [Streptomyces genisteinicus]|uniref:Uncharacterized protein n=1 Tax=Streptomyces genisteinicus TaxID=2768068 RepID=A0A7H0HN28_9ACTN|nr:DUF6629 family protein [Streptomyces genisteinicus]QNP61944.1 hypothetical protein IAG43_02730 [Streptomyces genisteinicus]